MPLNAAGEALLKRKEACRLTTYFDGAGVPTIGWGHTGPDVLDGETITQDEADMLLRRDVARFDRHVTLETGETRSNQHSALVVLCYNIGEAAFSASAVLRLHNEGNYAGAAQAFLQWKYIHVNGKPVVSEGLLQRRHEEAALYLTVDNDSPASTGAAAVMRPLSSSKTMNSATTAGAALVTGTGLDISRHVSDLQDQIAPLVGYMDELKYVLVGLAVFAIGVAMWSRWRDHRNGVN